MDKKVTELVFVIDRSGSMSGLESDTIGGFNSTIEKQREEGGEAYVTTVLFDTSFDTIHDRIKLSEVKKMTRKDYRVGGGTALLDALGDTIKHIKNIHKYARPEDVPAKTAFVIITDGMENSSHKYGSNEIKSMITDMQKKQDWEFIFLGANIDAVEVAKGYGIDENHSVKYFSDATGTTAAWAGITSCLCNIFMGNKCDGNWKKVIEKDLKKRK